jgi:hypothetical protein
MGSYDQGAVTLSASATVALQFVNNGLLEYV